MPACPCRVASESICLGKTQKRKSKDNFHIPFRILGVSALKSSPPHTAFDKAPSKTPRMAMRNVHKSFGATAALQGVGFTVDAGEVHALVGENGAGKSTLMKILSGAVRADQGEMLLDGQAFQPGNPPGAIPRPDS